MMFKNFYVQSVRRGLIKFHYNSGIYFVRQDVFWVVHVFVRVNVVYDPFDLLDPNFDLFVRNNRFVGFIHTSVRAAFDMCAAIPFALFFPTRTLFSIRAFGNTSVKQWNHIFDSFSFRAIFTPT